LICGQTSVTSSPGRRTTSLRAPRRPLAQICLRPAPLVHAATRTFISLVPPWYVTARGIDSCLFCERLRSFVVDSMLRVSVVQPGGSAATAIDVDAPGTQRPTLPAASAPAAQASSSRSAPMMASTNRSAADVVLSWQTVWCGSSAHGAIGSSPSVTCEIAM